MKKITVVILLAALLFNSNGIFLIFKIQQKKIQKEIKKQIKSNIPESQLHIFTFSKKEWSSLQWTKVNKEFCYRGSMYDVVAKTEKDNIIIAKCINDKEEENLFSNLNKLVNKRMNENMSNPLKKISQLILYCFYILPVSDRNESFSNPQNILCSSSFIHYLNPFGKKIIKPPIFS